MDALCGDFPEEKERMRSERKHYTEDIWKYCFPRIHLHVNSNCHSHKYIVQS